MPTEAEGNESDRGESQRSPVDLEAMLFAYAPRLLSYIQRQLPPELSRIVDPQDVLQDTFFEAFQRVEHFRPVGDNAAYRWLVTITRNRVLNLLRMQKQLKRGGGCKTADISDVISLLAELLVYSRTPSQSAMSHDVVRTVQQSIDRLDHDYREVIRYRYIDGLSLEQTATRMRRTQPSILALCNRGLKALRVELETALPA